MYLMLNLNKFTNFANCASILNRNLFARDHQHNLSVAEPKYFVANVETFVSIREPEQRKKWQGQKKLISIIEEEKLRIIIYIWSRLLREEIPAQKNEIFH